MTQLGNNAIKESEPFIVSECPTGYTPNVTLTIPLSEHTEIIHRETDTGEVESIATMDTAAWHEASMRAALPYEN